MLQAPLVPVKATPVHYPVRAGVSNNNRLQEPW